ncbi:MAG: hypothetical protein IT204_15030 [Fimbriimonadaceae bacterium]|nr:hypothetical protein [Fimbriimonadaceae bacterium]
MRLGRLCNVMPLLLVASLGRAAETTDPVVPAGDLAALQRALGERSTAAIWTSLATAAVDRATLTRLQDWVERGGTLWVETDLARSFGFQTAAVTARERWVHGRRAAPRGAWAALGQVDDAYGEVAVEGHLVTAHPNAVPLLQVHDPAVAYPARRYLAALLPWGRGQVVVRPRRFAAVRADGAAFEASLRAALPARLDEAVVPLETLQIAQQRLQQAGAMLRTEPAEAQKLLASVYLAFRLWYADYLTGSGKLDESTAVLGAVATELPDDPAVYLAVARLNDAAGRPNAAAVARQQASALYQSLQRQPPTPDARQVRVPYPIFATSINAVGSLQQQPTREAVTAAWARTAAWLGLEAYRRNDLVLCEQWWQAAAGALPTWPVLLHQRGLLAVSRGDLLAQPARDRARFYQQAAALFQAAAATAPSPEYPASAREVSQAWLRAATALATSAAADPPAAVVGQGVVVRYHDQDRRLQVGPLLRSQLDAAEEAYRFTTAWGWFAEDLEVLLFEDATALTAALPRDQAGRQAFGQAATVGRRVFLVADPLDLRRYLRHQIGHAAINALTEDGLPGPLWFEEGLASAAQRNGAQMAIASSNFRRGNVLGIEQINNPAVFFDRQLTDHAFGQAQLMTQAFVNRFGVDALALLLQATGWGAGPEEAFRRITALGQQEFLAALLEGRLN